MQRAERKEQQELAGRKKVETAMMRGLRMVQEKEKVCDIGAHPARIARAGKPLKR